MQIEFLVNFNNELSFLKIEQKIEDLNQKFL
jgi:hypothetical protein